MKKYRIVSEHGGVMADGFTTSKNAIEELAHWNEYYSIPTHIEEYDDSGLQIGRLIKDPEQVMMFMNILPELEEDEKYYFTVSARKKYCPDISFQKDKLALYRGLARSKSSLINMLIEINNNDWRIKGEAVPDEALCVYILPNPRSTKKALKLQFKKMLDYVLNENYDLSLVSEAYSMYQRCKSRTVFTDFDIDTKEICLSDIRDVIPKDYDEGAVWFVESKGGYHLLINPEEAVQAINTFNEQLDRTKDLTKLWHIKIRDIYPIDKYGDQLLPFPGMVQGGFSPKLIIP